MVNNRGYILHKTDHKKGQTWFYLWKYKKNHPCTPKQVVVNVFDLGYLGVDKNYPEQISSLPYKKKTNHEVLSQEEKEYNKIFPKKRG